ncbi:MAG: hypothetical protein AABY53_07895, partial [Bdellovibrionota bacterium]
MKDFIKIFLSISALVATFLIGRSYGEKTYLESVEHRGALKAVEDLNFAKADLENAKAKLQNITDRAGTLKTEELLAQILHVFLTDLGLRIQNKEVILKRTQDPVASSELRSKEAPPEEKNEEPGKYPVMSPPPEAPRKEAVWTKTNINKFKSLEWMVENSGDSAAAHRGLKKVQIKNLGTFLAQADQDIDGCEAFLGSYKGPIKDIEKKYIGSLEFELKLEGANSLAGDATRLSGKTAWYNSGRAVSEKFKDNCGKKIKGLSGRIFSLDADKYVQ